jgi:DNA-binding PadR family transcriptional regulator
MYKKPAPDRNLPLSALDFHVLLVLADGPLYGYAILKAVASESGGVVRPEIGSLYRVLARLLSEELVDEVTVKAATEGTHRGRSRRYYQLTGAGKAALKSEASRLEGVLAIARKRALLAGAGRS